MKLFFIEIYYIQWCSQDFRSRGTIYISYYILCILEYNFNLTKNICFIFFNDLIPTSEMILIEFFILND